MSILWISLHAEGDRFFTLSIDQSNCSIFCPTICFSSHQCLPHIPFVAFSASFIIDGTTADLYPTVTHYLIVKDHFAAHLKADSLGSDLYFLAAQTSKEEKKEEVAIGSETC